MANQNGQLILHALQELDEPATINKIAKQIAGVNSNDVKEAVKETLDGGVRYGFLQRIRQKYFAAPIKLDELTDAPTDAPTAASDVEIEKSSDVQDKVRRRRMPRKVNRRRRGGRRRTRSRS